MAISIKISAKKIIANDWVAASTEDKVTVGKIVTLSNKNAPSCLYQVVSITPGAFNKVMLKPITI